MKNGIKMDVKQGVCGAKLALITTALISLQACTLPGYELEDYGDRSPWYSLSTPDPRSKAAESEAEEQYKPELYQITPELIATRHGIQTVSGSDNGNKNAVNTTLPEDYRVGPGDVLTVIVFNHPELTNPAGTSESLESSGRLVNAQGEIFFPFVGEIGVSGLTLNEIRKKLADRLSRVIREPQLDVRVSQFRSQQVFIAGDISKPCAVPITDVPLTILRALDLCDSLSGDPGNTAVSSVKLTRQGQVFPLDLSEIYRTGEPVRLQNGDRIIVDRSASRVFVVGEFGSQVATPFPAAGMTLNDAIASGGGLNLSSADPGSIYVIRGFIDEKSDEQGKLKTVLRPKIFHLNANSVDALILADQFQLQPRDVVYAAPASLVNFNRALAQLTPSLDLLFRSFLIFDRSGN